MIFGGIKLDTRTPEQALGAKRGTATGVSNTQKRGAIRASSKIVRNPNRLNVKGIKAFAQVKMVSDGCYKIRTHSNKENISRIIAKLKAFNDMEIAYGDDLDGNELIQKSKAPLWALSESDNGVVTLQRQF